MNESMHVVLSIFTLSANPFIGFLQFTLYMVAITYGWYHYTTIRNFLLETKEGLWWLLLGWVMVCCLIWEASFLYWVFTGVALWLCGGICVHYRLRNRTIKWVIPFTTAEFQKLLTINDHRGYYCAGFYKAKKFRDGALDLAACNLYIDLPFYGYSTGIYHGKRYSGVGVTSDRIRRSMLIHGEETVLLPGLYHTPKQKCIRALIRWNWTLPQFSIREFLEHN